MADLTLNGVLEEDVGKFYHICFFTDRGGLDRDNADHFIFIPKSVCRIADYYTVHVQDWYVHKKGLDKFVRKHGASPVKTPSRRTPGQRPKTVMDEKKKLVDTMIEKLGKKQTEEILRKTGGKK